MPISDQHEWEPKGMPPHGQPLTRDVVLRWIGGPGHGPLTRSERRRQFWRRHWRWLVGLNNLGLCSCLGALVLIVFADRGPDWLKVLVMLGLFGGAACYRATLGVMDRSGLQRYHSGLARYLRTPWPGVSAVPGHRRRTWAQDEFVEPVEKPSPYPAIRADSEAVYVGDLTLCRIEWWQIRDIEERDDTWRVRWDGGTFILDQHDTWHTRVCMAAAGVLLARKRGCPIPGDPAGVGISDAALSRARMTGDQADERGLSRVDADQ